MKNLVEELIRERPSDWLEYLQSTYAIKAVQDDGLVSLKYNQIESPMDVPIVQQCRGMVVDLDAREVVAWPYNKFWNLGEARADTIDWSTARVLDKLDGSLMILYWHPRTGGWRVASSGHPTAGGSFGTDRARTFADAFWAVWDSEDLTLPGSVWQDVTFMFELCASENRIVVKHDRPRLVLHGARECGTEISHETLDTCSILIGCDLVESFPLTSAEDCATAAATLNPVAAEGFVVVDAAFHRVKIKSPRYVSLHHMKGEFSRRRAIELWQAGETSELAVHFPELRAEIDAVSGTLNRAAQQAAVDALHASAAAGADRKEYATRVKDRPWASACFRLFGMRQNEITPAGAAAVLRAQSVASLERLVEALS